jgi:hypothetical protein
MKPGHLRERRTRGTSWLSGSRACGSMPHLASAARVHFAPQLRCLLSDSRPGPRVVSSLIADRLRQEIRRGPPRSSGQGRRQLRPTDPARRVMDEASRRPTPTMSFAPQHRTKVGISDHEIARAAINGVNKRTHRPSSGILPHEAAITRSSGRLLLETGMMCGRVSVARYMTWEDVAHLGVDHAVTLPTHGRLTDPALPRRSPALDARRRSYTSGETRSLDFDAGQRLSCGSPITKEADHRSSPANFAPAGALGDSHISEPPSVSN